MINLIERSDIEPKADEQQPEKHPTSTFKQEIMKRKYLFHPYALHPLLMVVLAGGLFGECQREERSGSKHPEYVLFVKNPSSMDYSDYLVEITISELSADGYQPDLKHLIVMDGDVEIASQYSDDRLYVLIEHLRPGEEKQLRIIQGKSSTTHEKRTQAELSVKTGGHFENRKYISGSFQNIQYLRVPDEHTDHSFYIRYEGPGWESDLVGYRFYLDWRNATDVFGKKTHKMVLQQIGLDGFDSYHEMQDWGVDVLKVGKSLGIGSLAMYDGQQAVRIDQTDSVICSIAENGTIYSAVQTEYYGWKVGANVYDVSSRISIHAGTRLSHQEVYITNQPENLCTGIGKDSNAKLYAEQGSVDSWGYLASYGLQSLNNDHLGLAVFFAHQDYKGFTEDEFSHIVKLKVDEGKANYYFLAAWEGELGGVKSEGEFLTYVNEIAGKLAKPLAVNIEK